MMNDKANKMTWSEFENVVARLHQMFGKNAKITQDEKLWGWKSETLRQIDICVRAKVAGQELLVIIDCKNWKKKPDVPAIEKFAGMRDDVRAHAGIMVSLRGFTKHAYIRADKERLSLYTYRDTQQEPLSDDLPLAVFFEFWEIHAKSVRLLHSNGRGEDLTSEDAVNASFTDGTKSSVGSIIRKCWDEQLLSQVVENRACEWTVQIPCKSLNLASVQGIEVTAESRFVEGVRHGRLHFVGLEEKSKEKAHASTVKLVFDSVFTRCSRVDLEPGYFMVKSTTVLPLAPEQQTIRAAMFEGVLEFSFTAEDSPLEVPFNPQGSLVPFGQISGKDFRPVPGTGLRLEAPMVSVRNDS